MLSHSALDLEEQLLADLQNDLDSEHSTANGNGTVGGGKVRVRLWGVGVEGRIWRCWVEGKTEADITFQFLNASLLV